MLKAAEVFPTERQKLYNRRINWKLESLNNFIPEPKPSPIELVKFEGKQRERASKRNN